MTDAPTLFFDIGGVILTNGWDTAARKRAVGAFGLDPAEFQTRHEMLKTAFETGRLDIDTYIRRAVFHKERPFAADDFKAFMFEQSEPIEGGATLDFVRALADSGRYRIYALNNESRALHEHRVERFQLGSIFRGFLTSCYLGQVKPDEEIYRNALGIAACRRELALFIDDRELNVEPALALGLHAIRYTGFDQIRTYLKGQGIEA